jgi:predicted rRNA methylase YqxC with S4 and FtsJ domains
LVNSHENNVATETIDSNISLALDDDSFESARDLFESVDNAKKQENEMLFN